MYECPNCKGNLVFDIVSQDLHCSACDTHMDVYAFSKEEDAEESREYEVTVFTCPQCAGEIYSEDNTAAAFCTFCGGSTILDSRLTKEKRPQYILPFRKTKSDCKEAYLKRLKWAVFAPNNLKDPKHIDSFRGIYVPYWIYDMKLEGKLVLPGKTERRKGDYIYTKHYDVKGDVDCRYEGISFDASSSFADDISRRIAPYKVAEMKPFTPSYLSGFYADVSDVDDAIYRGKAEDYAKNQAIQFIRKDKDLKKYSCFDNIATVKNHMDMRSETATAVMFPVWFMSYRKDGRVAYATVNGQTGKVVADLPVDLGKYAIGSLVLTLILFFIINSFLFVRPTILLWLVCFLSFATMILYGREMVAIKKRDEGLDDAGMMYKKTMADKEPDNAKGDTAPKIVLPAIIQLILIIVGFFAFFYCLVLPMVRFFLNGKNNSMIYLLLCLVPVCIGIYYRKAWTYVRQEGKRVPWILGSVCSVIVAVIVLIWNPVKDFYYYMAVIVALVAELVAVFDLILHYNILVTRKLPQFQREGGNDSADESF